jgi:hypothetical protein
MHSGGFRSGGFGPGLATGAVIGSVLGRSYYGRGYFDDSYAYTGNGPVLGDDGYCAQRFRSYDPGSGTYLGYDGLHPCP